VTRYRLLLEYDGAAYVGWQRQPDAPSIQAEVESALAQVLGGEPVMVTASGRTDAGVHALGQVVSFQSTVERSPIALVRGLNAVLPDDIACRAAGEVELAFHPIDSAVGKHYRYRVLDGVARAPLRRGQVYQTHKRLDLDRVRAAAMHFVGCHDFSSFRASRCSAVTAVRTLYRFEITRPVDEVRFDVEGTGFLRHMVRVLVGTLLDVSSGRFEPEDIPAILDAADRRRAGRTAAAQGLTLMRVHYPDGWPGV
jgi:tRNA pseudouridine38-40 synthase